MEIHNFKFHDNKSITQIAYNPEIKDYVLITISILKIALFSILLTLLGLSASSTLLKIIGSIIFVVALRYIILEFRSILNRCYTTIIMNSDTSTIVKKQPFKKEETISGITSIELLRKGKAVEIDDEKVAIIVYDINAITSSGNKTILSIYNSKYFNFNEKNHFKISKQITQLMGRKLKRTTRIDNSIYKHHTGARKA